MILPITIIPIIFNGCHHTVCMYDMIAMGAIVSGIVAYLLMRRYQDQ